MRIDAIAEPAIGMSITGGMVVAPGTVVATGIVVVILALSFAIDLGF